MGSSVFQYIGAFVKVAPKNTIEIKRIMACSNPQCVVRDKFGNFKYCPECGAKIVETVDTKEKKWNYNAWADENDFVDRLINFNHDSKEFLFPNNFKSKASLINLNNYDDSCLIEFNKEFEINPEEHILGFKEAYNDILNKLKEDGIEHELIFGYFKGYH